MSDWLNRLIVRLSDEGTAAMDAGGVYHLLAQARPVEDPTCPRISEECGVHGDHPVCGGGFIGDDL